jgi:hypothetical protein
MKQIIFSIMAFVAMSAIYAQDETSTPSTQTSPGNLTEILVDGKHYALISEDTKSYTISVSFNPGRHEIRWVKKNTEQTVEIPDSGNAERTAFINDIDLPLAGRINIVDKIIEITEKEKDSIRVDIYDNGIIDNDSVSVFTDDLAVVTRQRVSAKPITFYTSIEQGKEKKMIRMEAQNLGLIPPNTSLMVVTTRFKKYVLHLKSDLLKNAVVQLELKKE